MGLPVTVEIGDASEDETSAQQPGAGSSDKTFQSHDAPTAGPCRPAPPDDGPRSTAPPCSLKKLALILARSVVRLLRAAPA